MEILWVKIHRENIVGENRIHRENIMGENSP